MKISYLYTISPQCLHLASRHSLIRSRKKPWTLVPPPLPTQKLSFFIFYVGCQYRCAVQVSTKYFHCRGYMIIYNKIKRKLSYFRSLKLLKKEHVRQILNLPPIFCKTDSASFLLASVILLKYVSYMFPMWHL